MQAEAAILDTTDYIAQIGRKAKEASGIIAIATTEQKNAALAAIAEAIEENAGGNSKRQRKRYGSWPGNAAHFCIARPSDINP